MASPAVAQSLTDAQARGIVSPRYSLFNVAPEATSIRSRSRYLDCESCRGEVSGTPAGELLGASA